MTKNRTAPLALALALLAATAAPRPALGNTPPHASEVVVTSTFAPDSSTEKTVKADASETEAAADDSQQPKRKGNGFVRALTAPFRALARLFGGGKKSTTEAAKKREQRPAQAATADNSAETPVTPKPAEVSKAEVSKAEVSKTEGDASAQSSQQQPSPAATRPAEPSPVTSSSAASSSAASSSAASSSVASSSSPAYAPAVVAPTPAPLLSETSVRSAPSAAWPAEGARVVRPGEAGAVVELPKMWVPVVEGISKDPLTQGRALLERGYVQEAISELTVAATQVGPGLVEANNLLGIAYDRMGWHTQAAEAYRRALTVAPKDAVVLANFGYSLYLADDYQGALKRLKQAAKLAPGTPVIYNNLGIVQARLGKYDEAYKHFAIASNEYDAHLKLASLLEDQKRDRDAIKHYEAALAMQPGASAVLERLVALYERTGERDKADSARKALGQPKNQQKTTTGGGGD